MRMSLFFFFFNDTATTEIYTLSLHDALPDLLRYRFEAISPSGTPKGIAPAQRQSTSKLQPGTTRRRPSPARILDRKSTRLNSSHANISYAVFCLKKKKFTGIHRTTLLLQSNK